MFEDEAGNVQTLLNENVHGIVENTAGIFVFTGLSHLSINEGYIYIVATEEDEKLRLSRLGRLPGAPRQIQKHADGSISFLVFAGYRDDRRYYECYSLTGEIVARSTNCAQPKTTAY